MFSLQSNPPDHSRICQEELLGVTAVILSVSYKQKEFFRVGYYVYNYYEDPELNDNPPDVVRIDKITRNILADKPRITRFEIKWGNEEENIDSTEAHSQENNNENANPNKLFFNSEDQNMELAKKENSNPFMSDTYQQLNSIMDKPSDLFGSK